MIPAASLPSAAQSYVIPIPENDSFTQSMSTLYWKQDRSENDCWISLVRSELPECDSADDSDSEQDLKPIYSLKSLKAWKGDFCDDLKPKSKQKPVHSLMPLKPAGQDVCDDPKPTSVGSGRNLKRKREPEKETLELITSDTEERICRLKELRLERKLKWPKELISMVGDCLRDWQSTDLAELKSFFGKHFREDPIKDQKVEQIRTATILARPYPKEEEEEEECSSEELLKQIRVAIQCHQQSRVTIQGLNGDISMDVSEGKEFRLPRVYRWEKAKFQMLVTTNIQKGMKLKNTSLFHLLLDAEPEPLTYGRSDEGDADCVQAPLTDLVKKMRALST